MKRRTDRALRTAKKILDRVVCECGHVESEHSSHSEPHECCNEMCDCMGFDPVKFTVERAS